jgi:alkanesulfonate monooxygenase SsuD/methylene tetrahydromethanopterin reductase-like flavin-dependent oxidoreductase (luciferase family)
VTIQLVANYTSVGVDPMAFAVAAEAAGYDGVSCSDHFFRRTAYPHIWVTLASMACATKNVFLSSSFANNLFRSPVEFAQASLSMQQLSGGRFEAGLGAGWLAPEVTGSGLEYPDPPARARRYRESVLIVRELLATGKCTFDGDHYHVDVPVIGPACDTPPPLVASLGGPWTIRHIAPLVDRVELKFGRTTRAGDLDMAALTTITRDELRAMVAEVRDVAPDVPIGVFAMIAAGQSAEVDAVRQLLGDSFYGGFAGPPEQVLDNLQELESLGIQRVQLSELVKGSVLRLQPR